MEDSIILGRLVDEMGEETQEEVNEESLFFHDQRELLDKISDKEVSKYEIMFLMDNLHEAGGVYYVAVLKQLINTFYLNPLKLFLDYELTSERITETKKLLMYLKSDLPYILRDKNGHKQGKIC